MRTFIRSYFANSNFNLDHRLFLVICLCLQSLALLSPYCCLIESYLLVNALAFQMLTSARISVLNELAGSINKDFD